jgi:hypothetical protein
MDQIATPFSITLPIHPEESLNGYFLRVAKDLLLPGPGSVLPAAEAEARNLAELHRRGRGMEAIATRLGVPREELDRRRYESVPEFQNLVCFAGNWFDRPDFLRSSPHVAPHAFRLTGIHRMSWDLNFVVADPETGERLIGACPHCSEEFSWGKSDFLSCHACGQALATGAPDLIDNETRTAIAGFADLVSLDADRSKAGWAAFPQEIRDLGAGRLFKFVFSLAAGMDQEEAARRPKNKLDRLIELKRPGRRTAHLDWHKAVLRAFQIATGWPEALVAYLEEEKMGSEARAGAYGTKRAWGYFQILLREWSAEAEIWAVVIPAIRMFLDAHPEISLKPGTFLAEAVGDVSDAIMLRDVRAKYGWSHRRISELVKFPGVLLTEGKGSGTPLRISRKRVEEIMKTLEGMISARTLRAEWRLRHEVIDDLCTSGLLKPVEPEYLQLVGNVKALYRRSEVDTVFKALEAAVRPARTAGTRVTTRSVVDMAKQRFKYPWSSVAAAVVKGELVPIGFDPKAHNFFERLIFDRDTAHRWAYQAMGIDNPTVSPAEAAARLMVDGTIIAALVRDNLLEVYRDLNGGASHRIRIADLEQFDSTYISQNKLRKVHEARARGLKIHPELVVASCLHFGIEPLAIRGMPTRFYPKAAFPKDFRILSRKELHDAGALRNTIRIVRRDQSRRAHTT